MLVSELFGLHGPELPPNKDMMARRKSKRLVDSSEFIGVEVELEGCANEFEYGPTFERYWSLKPEGSIRNNENGVGIEYVFRNPLHGKQITGALRIFSRRIAQMKADPSWRCGTHVHLNMSDSDTDELLLFLLLYILFEPAIYNYVGDFRRKSPFCVPITADADNCASLIKIFKDLKNKNSGDVGRVGMRLSNYCKYNGLNLRTLTNFGTVEFRMAPSMTEYDDLVNWVNIILSLKKATKTLSRGGDADLIFNFHNFLSQMGVHELARIAFSEDILERLYYPGFEDEGIENARLIQHILLSTEKEEICREAREFIKPVGLREKFLQKFEDFETDEEPDLD